MPRYLLNSLAFFLLVWASPVSADTWCGDPPGRALDYLNERHRQHLGVVERVHFTDDVRTLRRGATGSIAGDIDYVLNWFANHHGALDAMARLAVREGTNVPRRASWPVECRFHWAARVNPRDGMVPLIRGMYHHRSGDDVSARQYLERAVDLSPNNPEIRYNAGLILFRLGHYEAARNHARRAYSLGHPLPGLRNMLAEAGYPL